MSAAPKVPLDFIIERLEEIPTLPSVVYELTQVINDPMSSTKEVEKIMSTDQSMTTKVLKLVNSAYYAIPGGVSSLSRAIAYIGFDTVNQLALSSSILQALDAKGPSTFDINEFWKHSVGVGIAAETIAKFTNHPLPSDMFTCGLVHDMGKIALFSIDRTILESISDEARNNNISFFEAEKRIDIPHHTVIGQLLAEKWALPQQLAAVIKNHHQPDPNRRGGISADLNKAVDIVYLANLLIHALKFGNSGHNVISGAPKETLQRLGIKPDIGFKALIKNIKENLDKAEDFIRVICG